jgi:hypothetical protein
MGYNNTVVQQKAMLLESFIYLILSVLIYTIFLLFVKIGAYLQFLVLYYTKRELQVTELGMLIYHSLCLTKYSYNVTHTAHTKQGHVQNTVHCFPVCLMLSICRVPCGIITFNSCEQRSCLYNIF